jgi:hypothetical protein
MPISRRYVCRYSDDSYLRPRHRFYNLTPIQRYHEVLFEKWTMAAIWLDAMQEYWSDKQSGVTLSTYADFGDMNEDLWRRVDLAHASRIDRYGPAEINRYEVWDLVDRYGPPEIPCM